MPTTGLVDTCLAGHCVLRERDAAVRARPVGVWISGAVFVCSEFVPIEEVLGEIVARAVQIMPGAELASVTLLEPHGGYTTPVETDPVATRLDQLQYRSDEGPCLEATRIPGRGVAFSPNLATDGQ